VKVCRAGFNGSAAGSMSILIVLLLFLKLVFVFLACVLWFFACHITLLWLHVLTKAGFVV